MTANLSILKRHSFLGNTLRILKNPVDFLGGLPKLYGPVIVANFGGKKYFILQHPEYIKHVLVDNYKGYYKPGATKLLRLFLGEGLITTNGGLWLKQRRLLQPAFHKQKLVNMLDIINDETTLLIKKLDAFPKNTPINISNEFLKLDISIISKAIFSSSLENEMSTLVKTLDELTGYASSWMKSIIKIPLNWPTASNINFK
jgi:cytochrome P450